MPESRTGPHLVSKLALDFAIWKKSLPQKWSQWRGGGRRPIGVGGGEKALLLRGAEKRGCG